MRFQSCFLFGLVLGGSFHLSADILYTVTDLGTLGAFSRGSTGESLNNAGQVTGYADAPASFRTHAFLYSNGHMTDLGTLDGSYSGGYGINNAGQVTGESGYHAFLYTNGQMRDLGALGEA